MVATRLKYDMLFDQVSTQGAAATARAAELGEEAFRLPNGELMSAEKFMDRTQMLTQTRATLERSDAKLRKILEEYAVLKKEKELVVNEAKRYCVIVGGSFSGLTAACVCQVRNPAFTVRKFQAL